MTASALYPGATRHRRLGPTPHSFRSSLRFVLLDHDELDAPDGPTRPGGPLGPEWWWPVHYRRTDYLDGDPTTPLGTAVRDLVEARTGRRPRGPVRTLTQPRTLGYVFNPITVHYCLSGAANATAAPTLEVVVLEVTNTPWHERHCYVIDARPGADSSLTPGPVAVGTVDRRGRLHAEMPKQLHVSPFMELDQTYRFTCTAPGDRIWLRLESFEAGAGDDGEPTKVFEADMAVRRMPLTRRALLRQLLSHPFSTHRVWAGIHLHAALLAAKRVPFVPHPDRTGTARPTVGAGARGKVDRT